MTWTSDARSVNGWFCAAFGRRRARKVRKRKTTVDRDRSQLSIKKRTTKKGGDGEERCALAWVCSSSPIKGVHDPRCDHSHTVAPNLYPGSVAGVGHFRLGRHVLPEHEPSYLGLTYLGTSTSPAHPRGQARRLHARTAAQHLSGTQAARGTHSHHGSTGCLRNGAPTHHCSACR